MPWAEVVDSLRDDCCCCVCCCCWTTSSFINSANAFCVSMNESNLKSSSTDCDWLLLLYCCATPYHLNYFDQIYLLAPVFADVIKRLDKINLIKFISILKNYLKAKKLTTVLINKIAVETIIFQQIDHIKVSHRLMSFNILNWSCCCCCCRFLWKSKNFDMFPE